MKLIRLILCFYVLFGLSNITFAAGVSPTDKNVCSNLTELTNPDPMFIELAKERFLFCSDKFDYSIPENAHKVNNQRIDGAFIENGWVCNSDFFKKGKKCQRVPANAYSKYNSNKWFCKSNFYKNSSLTGCLVLPSNATKTSDLSFSCNSGYRKSTSGRDCVTISTPTSDNTPKQSIPTNARKVSNEMIDDEWITSGWVCKKNYYITNDKTGCRPVPQNAYSDANSNKAYCNDGYEPNSSGSRCIKESSNTTSSSGSSPSTTISSPTPVPRITQNDNSDFFKVAITILIILIVLWLILKPSSPEPTTKPRDTQRPRTRSTPKPQPRSTTTSKYKPPIKSQTKQVPKAQPKSKTTNINNPNLLLIEIGVAVAFIDGNLSDEEGAALKEWMTKTYKHDGSSSSSKQLFNETFTDAIKAAKAGNLDVQDICRLLNNKGTKELNKEAFRFAYEIMGADGEIHKNEVKMIKLLEKNLQISSDDVTRIRDRFLLKTIIKKDFKIINLLGLGVSPSSQTICRELTKEFSKWNANINLVKTKKERDNIQKVLELIGEARKENDC